MTDKSIPIYPSSVKKFTYEQLATAFIKLSKFSKICKQTIPNIFNMSQDIKKVATWKIDIQYGNIEGIGDMNNMIVKIMLYSKTPQQKTNVSHITTNNSIYITTVQKQLIDLKNQLSILQNTSPSDTQISVIEKEIVLKSKLLDKLSTASTKTYENENDEFTQQQMGSIAKRVFDILADSNTAYKLFNEIEYQMKPKTDYIKESTGGDYVLRNSTRDRRFEGVNKEWMENKKKIDIMKKIMINIRKKIKVNG